MNIEMYLAELEGWHLLLGIALATFILEDAALFAAVALISIDRLGVFEALMSLTVGVFVGDLGLYVMGRFLQKSKWINSKLTPERLQWAEDFISKRGTMGIFIARAIPGLRLPVYTALGFFRFSLVHFIIATLAAVLIWELTILFFAVYVGTFAADVFMVEKWMVSLGILVVAMIALRYIPRAKIDAPSKPKK